MYARAWPVLLFFIWIWSDQNWRLVLFHIMCVFSMHQIEWKYDFVTKIMSIRCGGYSLIMIEVEKSNLSTCKIAYTAISQRAFYSCETTSIQFSSIGSSITAAVMLIAIHKIPFYSEVRNEINFCLDHLWRTHLVFIICAEVRHSNASIQTSGNLLCK